MINVFLLILGILLDYKPIVLLVAPILYPIVMTISVDPIQFESMFLAFL
ncbi:TRAP transporter large permease subunit [Bacillus sp. MRMR6]